MNRLFKKSRGIPPPKSSDIQPLLTPPHPLTVNSQLVSEDLVVEQNLCKITVWGDNDTRKYVYVTDHSPVLLFPPPEDDVIDVVRLEVPVLPKVRSLSFDASALHEGEISDVDGGTCLTLHVPSIDNWSGSECSASERDGNNLLKVDIPKCFRRRSLEVQKPCIHCVHLETLQGSSQDSSVCSTPASVLCNDKTIGRKGEADGCSSFIYEMDTDDESDEDLHLDLPTDDSMYENLALIQSHLKSGNITNIDELSSDLFKFKFNNIPECSMDVTSSNASGEGTSSNSSRENSLGSSRLGGECLPNGERLPGVGLRHSTGVRRLVKQCGVVSSNPSPLCSFSTDLDPELNEVDEGVNIPTLSISIDSPSNSTWDVWRLSDMETLNQLPLAAAVSVSTSLGTTTGINRLQPSLQVGDESDVMQTICPLKRRTAYHKANIRDIFDRRQKTRLPPVSLLKSENQSLVHSSDSNASLVSSVDTTEDCTDYRETSLQIPLIKLRSSSMDATYLSVRIEDSEDRRGSCENLLRVDTSKQQRSTSVDVNLPTDENTTYRAITHCNTEHNRFVVLLCQ